MKRALVVLLLGLLAAGASYGTFYFCGTREHRQMACSPEPELAWLKKEFQLSDSEFDRISTLHRGYLPRCEELCRRIAAKNSEVRQLTASNAAPELIAQRLKEAADLRLDCHTNMLGHFVAVSRQMSPEQGRRYLEWVQARTLAPGQEDAMAARHHGAEHSGHH